MKSARENLVDIVRYIQQDLPRSRFENVKIMNKHKCTCTHKQTMVTKTITITEEAYLLLKQKKKSGESFSEVIIKHFGEKSSILDLYGTWEGEEAEWDQILAGIQDAWKGWHVTLPPED
nr:antitoxin VapB family protein [Candidatus Sigynarchaeota archaeon]